MSRLHFSAAAVSKDGRNRIITDQQDIASGVPADLTRAGRQGRPRCGSVAETNGVTAPPMPEAGT
jgi:hypothetical protein